MDRRIAALALAGLTAGTAAATGLLTAGTARAQASAPGAGPDVVTVAAPADAAVPGDLDLTLALSPADRAGLATLASSREHRSHVQRAQALAQVAPSQATRTALTALMRADGLTVTQTEDWDLHVRGPEAAVEKAFDVTETGTPTSYRPDRQPTLPAGVDAVLGLDNRPIYRPLDTPYGNQPRALKAAYAVDRPQSTGFGTTVATIQFSGWDSSAFAHYAAEIGQSVQPGQLTQISVDGDDTTAPVGGGDVEVALDQETLFGAAPLASQRAYFGPNTEQGTEDTFSTLAGAVTTSGIDAVSDSWGVCEAGTGSDTAYRTAIQTAVQRMLAGGATFFSSTGDSGAYDCSTPDNPDDTLAVDFPASLPESVGVGGTTLTNPTTTPSESAWSAPSGSSSPNYLGSGSGGGTSTLYARPSYQSGVGISGSKRLLPDVSADGDPNTGVGIYTTTNGDQQVGGTSLSAPLWAGHLADALSSLGCSTGVGDIHALLYSSTSLTDVTSGTNLHYSATTGYDEATGLGTPIWRRLALDLQPSAGCSGGDYFPVTPARILDTRNGTGASQAKVGAGSSINVTVLGAGGIPSTGVSAVVLNVTAVAPTNGTYLTVWPAGSTRPNASTVNLAAGTVVPNLVSVGVGTGGAVSIYNAAGSVDVLADVQGYYSDGTDPTLGSRFVPLSPTRLLDTRNGTGAAQARVGAGSTVSFTVAGSGGVAASNVSAVELNVTAVAPTALTFITAYGSGTSRPTVSNLNPSAGETVPNLAIVPVGSDGKVTLYNDQGSVDLVADVVGYFASAAGTTGTRFVPLVPSRLLDTRNGTGVAQGQLGSSSTLALTVLGVGGVPAATATAVVLNVTAVAPSNGTYLTVYPDGVTRPNASSLNVPAGGTVANLVAVKVGSTGKVDIYNAAGSTDVLADVVGYDYA